MMGNMAKILHHGSVATTDSAFKVAQIKFLAMHITNQKISFDIFTAQNILMEHDHYLIS